MRNILLKILSILLCVVLVQYFVECYRLPDEFAGLAKIRTIGTNDILYFGDSSVGFSSGGDADRRSMAEFLEEKVGMRVVRDDFAGFTISTYLAHMQYLVQCGARPKLVVVPINMRSFSPQWDTNPMFQFKHEEFVAKAGFWRAFYKPICTYTDYFRIGSRDTWLTTDVYDGTRVVGKVRDFEGDSFRTATPERTRAKIVYHYRYNLAADHRKIQELKKLCSLAAENGVPLLVYFTPIDLESCDAYCCGTSSQVKRNVAMVQKALDEVAVPYLDMSGALGSNSFNWRGNLYPNEHLGEAGRRYVARTLAAAVDLTKPGAADRKMTE